MFLVFFPLNMNVKQPEIKPNILVCYTGYLLFIIYMGFLRWKKREK